MMLSFFGGVFSLTLSPWLYVIHQQIKKQKKKQNGYDWILTVPEKSWEAAQVLKICTYAVWNYGPK